MSTIEQAINYCIERSGDLKAKTRRHGIPGIMMNKRPDELKRFDPKEGEEETTEAVAEAVAEGTEGSGEGEGKQD